MGNRSSGPYGKTSAEAAAMRQKALQILEKKAFNKELDDEELQEYFGKMYEMDEVDRQASLVNIEEYCFPFENLIFEGGGNKGLAYIGCIKCLEDLGMMPQIKRLAGSSAGAIYAASAALGFTSKDLQEFYSQNSEKFFLDHSFGILSLLPNVLKDFGWNPGNTVYKWFGEKVKAKSAEGNPDMTFYDLYRERKIELCVVVTNLNQMREEYCHVKTTPNMPIREAVRMSISIPIVFAPRFYDNNGQRDTYVDGGVLCNYPIHCFDGWYLSMSRENSFLQKMSPLNDLPFIISKRFEEINWKSLGFLVYDETEQDVMRFNLEKRIGANDPSEPSVHTKLYKKKQAKKKIAANAKREHSRTVKAVEAFMKVLSKYNLVEFEFIDIDEFTEALNDKEMFSDEHRTLLFGPDIDVDEVFSILDRDCNGRIAFVELLHFVEKHGVRMQTRFQGVGRCEINSFSQFLIALENTVSTNLKYIYLKTHDEDRTVGINTGHVETSDYDLEEADKLFLVQRGFNATRAFLKYYVAKNPNTPRKPKADDATISS